MNSSDTLPFLCSKSADAIHSTPLSKGRFRGVSTGGSYIHSFTILLLITLLIACGSSDEDRGGVADTSEVESDTRIFNRDVTLSSDDLVGLGLKSGKKYNVETLPGGIEARLLYWRVNNVAVEYEARFYETHEEAATSGTAPAEEGSGEDAILDSDDAVYKEGIRDRRTIFDFRGAPKPKYGAYAIYGNMVVLCEGKDDAEGWDRCSALIEALDNR